MRLSLLGDGAAADDAPPPLPPSSCGGGDDDMPPFSRPPLLSRGRHHHRTAAALLLLRLVYNLHKLAASAVPSGATAEVAAPFASSSSSSSSSSSYWWLLRPATQALVQHTLSLLHIDTRLHSSFSTSSVVRVCVDVCFWLLSPISTSFHFPRRWSEGSFSVCHLPPCVCERNNKRIYVYI